APLLAAPQGAHDPAHGRLHQPAHRLARRDRERQAAPRGAAADQHGRSEERVLGAFTRAGGRQRLLRRESPHGAEKTRTSYSAATLAADFIFDRLMWSRFAPSMRTSLVTVSRLGEWITCTS